MSISQGHTYIIDRFEGERAVLEVAIGETFDVPKAWLPEDAAGGDVLTPSLEASSRKCSVQLTVDAEETAARRQSVRELQRQLPKDPEDDLEL